MAVLWVTCNAFSSPLERTFHSVKQALIAEMAAETNFDVEYDVSSDVECRTDVDDGFIDMAIYGKPAQIAKLLEKIYQKTRLTDFTVCIEEGEDSFPLKELERCYLGLIGSLEVI
ncbi:MAG: hypothetical protein AB1330_01835 [Bacillota bacterium]